MTTRDFSRATVKELYATIDDIRKDGQWGIADFFTDLWESVPDTSDVKAHQRAVLDTCDIGEKELDGILRTVESVDSGYEQQLIDCANLVDEFQQRVRNVADLITPAVISTDPKTFAGLGDEIAADYAETARDTEAALAESQGGIDQMLDDQQPWYEKLANGVGGFAVGVVDSAVVGPLGDLYGVVDDVFGTDFQQDLEDLSDQGKDYVLNHWVTNEQWYLGGKATGDATAAVGGVVLAAAGIATMAGSVTIAAGGTAASATGIGAVVGVPAIAVSVAGLAEGAAMTGAGVAMAVSGGENAGKDWAASQAAGSRGSEPPSYSGDLEKVPKPDADADRLADRIGGESRVKFSNDAEGREFDAVSDDYIAQAKPGGFTMGKSFRKQAKATFEAASATGRKVYYHFDGPPGPGVSEKLREYAERYGVEVHIDEEPF